MGDYMVIGIVFVFVVLMSILPKPVYNAITRAFSMHKNGIRRIQKYRTTTDSIGNLMLGISIVFCIFYCFIPFYSFLYSIFFIVSYLCLLAQAYRVTTKKPKQIAKTVIFLTNLFAGVSFLGALGFLNGHASVAVINQFMIDFHARIRYSTSYTFYKIVLGCIGCFKVHCLCFHSLLCGHTLNICDWRIVSKQFIL